MVFRTEWQARREYKAKVKKRFVQWVLDACFGHHDQAWLDCQEEIGLRHTPEKKNQTDGAHTPAVAPLRYLIAFGTVVASARGGSLSMPESEVNRIENRLDEEYRR